MHEKILVVKLLTLDSDFSSIAAIEILSFP